MPQVKKADRRDAIVAAAFALFSSSGYTSTTMSAIARAAQMTVANLYVYFDSKLLILYEIYRPWLYRQLETLKTDVAALGTPREKLERLLVGLWRDIPAADHSFANALIEALANVPAESGKPDSLLAEVEQFVTTVLIDAVPAKRRSAVEDGTLAHIVWMAFDGFVINQRIGDLRDIDRIASLTTTLLLGEALH